MKYTYLKKSIELRKLINYLYNHEDEFWNGETETLEEIDEETREVQLCNYIEIPEINITLHFCYYEYYNSDSDDYEIELNYPYTIVRNLDSEEILYSEESTDIENIVYNYLADLNDDLIYEELLETDKFNKLRCNIVKA